MHTYVDEADNTLTITDRPGPRLVTKMLLPTDDEQGAVEHVASVTAPKGPDAVEMACAVLAAAGDTGFEVVSSKELAQLRRERSLRDSACLEAVRAFRDLAAQEVLIDTHRAPMAISEAIAALPLIPDGNPGDTGHEVVEEQSNDTAEDFDSAWAESYIHAYARDAAESMRERAAVAATDNTNDDYDIRRKIRALPLLPDEPAREPLTAATDA